MKRTTSNRACDQAKHAHLVDGTPTLHRQSRVLADQERRIADDKNQVRAGTGLDPVAANDRLPRQQAPASAFSSRVIHCRCRQITYLLLSRSMDYTISYYSEAVQEQILSLPDTLAARYVVLTRRMVALGPNLGEPHTKAFGEGLFEMRLKGAEGIALSSSARW